MYKFFSKLPPLLARGNSRILFLLAGLGALCGIITSMVLTGIVVPAALPAIVAPIGASSVLVFALPASPLAGPRAVILGNVISAAIGVAVSMVIENQMLGAGIAVGLAIMGMSATRSLHPPGGAAALTAVLLHPSSAGVGAAVLFPFVPVGLNSLLLVCVGIAFHRLDGRSYPHKAVPASQQAEQAAGLHRDDVLAALHKTNETFDIELEDLERLLVLAELHAQERQTAVQKPAFPSKPASLTLRPATPRPSAA